ncbi:RNB-domain-containing protein [Trichoderma citrinoviride]|uniref:RNB-domain-containing protein n=1 Tax=Trichoderma citrinoviride TaxID=58853 RepID=A0A2T4BKI2_9HYPO|nr:RNB-domain-containing protein [Trichoderma citrinoviride]PTB69815.1 RNB-domain-containing protein [Trichoderma citrinoviride]
MLACQSFQRQCLLRSRCCAITGRLTRAHSVSQPKTAFLGLQRPQPKYGQDHLPTSASQLESANQHAPYLPIRKRLRLWTAQHGEQTNADSMPPDMVLYGGVSNHLSRTQSTGSSEMDQLRPVQTGMTDEFEEDLGGDEPETAAVGGSTRQPGDLVELKQTGSRVPLFAIYLGYFGERNHFYASNGRWLTSMGYSPLFTVAKFVTQEELAPVLAKMPQNGSPELFEELRRNEKGPSRDDGARLIEKMVDFRLKADAVHQSNLGKLDAVRTFLSTRRQVSYLSLFEIADILLPASLKANGQFPPFALYAVHSALYQNDVGFRPLSPTSDCHRRDHLFEVFPQSHAHVINRVVAMVRDYTATSGKRLRSPTPDELEDTALGLFILQARRTVQASRSKRQWTPHGILAPADGMQLEQPEWSQSSKEIIAFLEWWASYDLFEPGSRFHGYGALILRALQLYDDAVLDQSTAWTFLQEIGIIPPWEVPSRYKVRFPEVKIIRGGGLERETPKDIENSKRPDIAAGSRRAYTQSTIFCIDAVSTMVIDDGISLERTDNPDEFWLHVHAADPASCIKPNSDLCKFMELIPENIYLPGHFQAMLPSNLGEEEDAKDYASDGLVGQFSLKSGSPALTFSAKVNRAGDLLDFKVEPSTLDKVVYLDPEDVSRFCNEPPPPPALKSKRLSKGAWPYFFPRPSVSVKQGDAPDTTDTSSFDTTETFSFLPADPYIKAGYEASTGCSVVSNTMVLAGEIAARWCSSRGIPIPYRRDVKFGHGGKGAFDYATKHIYPLIQKGIEPSGSQRQELIRHTGGIEIASQPGPYFLLGLDMYAKATSPLRRFSDLLVHWQIHAALEHERKTQRTIDPDTDNLDAILPFTSSQLATTLPLLQVREKMARTVSRGILEWILIALVRAWRFEKTAPEKLLFTVGSRWRQGCIGKVDFFDLHAIMDIEGLNQKVLIKDVRVGDQFEVEIADVNVHSRRILVKALKYLGSNAGETSPMPALT